MVEFTRMYLELSDIPRYGQLGLPADATVLYVTALSDSSVEKFRSYMNTLYNELALDMTKYSLEDIMSITDQCYHDLVACSQWINGWCLWTFFWLHCLNHGSVSQKEEPQEGCCLL